MKKIITISILSVALLTACERDADGPVRTMTEAMIEELMTDFDGGIDMDAFLADAQQGVWLVDGYDITYTNGHVEDGTKIDGPGFIYPMMLLPEGVCRKFFVLMYLPGPIVYSEIEWSVSDRAANTLVLYSSGIEKGAEKENYDHYVARTTLELLYYRDGVFIMKGLQPFAYIGGATAEGYYEEFCTIVGRIVTDRATVDKFLSYKSYEQSER